MNICSQNSKDTILSKIYLSQPFKIIDMLLKREKWARMNNMQEEVEVL
jgi:hypothetical protein